MNSNPEIASQWNGRVLLNISIENAQQPKLKVEKLEPRFRQEATKRNLFALKEFDVIAEVT